MRAESFHALSRAQRERQRVNGECGAGAGLVGRGRRGGWAGVWADDAAEAGIGGRMLRYFGAEFTTDVRSSDVGLATSPRRRHIAVFLFARRCNVRNEAVRYTCTVV